MTELFDKSFWSKTFYSLAEILLLAMFFATVTTADVRLIEASNELAYFSRSGYWIDASSLFIAGFFLVTTLKNASEKYSAVTKSILVTALFVLIINVTLGPGKMLWIFPLKQILSHMGMNFISGVLVSLASE